MPKKKNLSTNWNNQYKNIKDNLKNGPVTTGKLTPEQMAKLFK